MAGGLHLAAGLAAGLLAGVFGRLAAARFLPRAAEHGAGVDLVDPPTRFGGAQASDLWLGLAGVALVGLVNLPVLTTFVLLASLATAGATDTARRLVPDAAVVAMALLGLMTAAPGQGMLVARLATAGVLLAILLALHFVHRRMTGDDGLGLGDVKLLAAMGVWLSPTAAAMMVALTTLLALAWLVVERRRGRTVEGVALAPFAVIAFVLVLTAQAELAS